MDVWPRTNLLTLYINDIIEQQTPRLYKNDIIYSDIFRYVIHFSLIITAP